MSPLHEPNGGSPLAAAGIAPSFAHDAGWTLAAVLRSSPLALVAVDRKGAVVVWSPAAERLFGWRADEMLGRPLQCIPPEDEEAFREAFQRVLQGDSIESREVQRLRSDGTRVDVTLSLTPLRDEDGRVVGALGMLSDISERKAAERQRDAASRIVELALRRGRMIAGRLEVDSGRISWTSADGADSFWRGPAPASVAELLVRVHPADREQLAAAARSREPAVEIEFRVLDDGGEARWLSAHGLLVADEEAEAERVGVVVDVTEARTRAEELRRTSETLRSIIAASPLAITATDPEGRVTLWSSAAERMFGWSAEEVLGRELPFVPEGEHEELAALRHRVLAGETVVGREVVRAHRDGRALEASLSLAPIRDAEGVVTGLVGVLEDLTERRRVEAQLSAVLDASPLAAGAVDAEHRVTIWNPAAERLFMRSQAEILGRDLREVMPAGAPHLEELYRQARRGQVFTDVPAAFTLHDGSTFDASVSLAPIRANGHVTGVLALVADVTERLRRERELRDAEERYRTLVEQIPAIVYVDVADPTGRPLYVSPQVEELLGVDQEEWLAGGFSLWLDLVHPEDREQARAAFLEAVADGEPLDVEYRAIGRDGQVRWFRDHARILAATDTRPALLHGVMLDITSRKAAEAETALGLEVLRKTDEERGRLLSRLVSAQEEERRRIAADLHDDTIQALTAVGLRLAALRTEIEQMGRAAAESFDELEETVTLTLRRLRNLLFDLRPLELDRGGLVPALRIHLEQLRRDFGLEFELTSRVEGELPREARAVAFRIAQEALANVRKHAGASRVAVALETINEGVLVTVSDDGLGFDVEHALRHPEPSHLGLIAMRERAELAGGLLRLTSEIGRGTTVEFWIPRTPAAAP